MKLIYKLPLAAVAKARHIKRRGPKPANRHNTANENDITYCADCIYGKRNGITGVMLLCDNDDGLNMFIDERDYCSRAERGET